MVTMVWKCKENFREQFTLQRRTTGNAKEWNPQEGRRDEDGAWLIHGPTEDDIGDRHMWSRLVLDEGNHCTVDRLSINEMNV
jgi:hypothetical protein